MTASEAQELPCLIGIAFVGCEAQGGEIILARRVEVETDGNMPTVVFEASMDQVGRATFVAAFLVDKVLRQLRTDAVLEVDETTNRQAFQLRNGNSDFGMAALQFLVASENVVENTSVLVFDDRRVDHTATASEDTDRVRMSRVAAVVPGDDLFTTDVADVIRHRLILREEMNLNRKVQVVYFIML